MASILSHFCNVERGESPGNMNRENTTVDTSAETTLYSGRVCHLDGSGKAVEGASGSDDPLYFAHRGVEHPDVGGISTIGANFTGGAGGGVISLIPLVPGYRIQTSEYNSAHSFSIGDSVKCASGSGELVPATGATDAIGVVAQGPTGVNGGDGISVIGIEVLKIAPYL